MPPRIRRAVLLPILALAALALAVFSSDAAPVRAAAPAQITMGEVLSDTLSTAGTSSAVCHANRLSGAGVVTKTVEVGGFGPISARLAGAAGDWDLAIFDDQGRQLAGSAGPRADEVAEGWAWKAGTLTVQACRREGASETAKVTLEHGTVPDALSDWLLTQKVQVVDVKTPTRADRQRLTSLGFDMTEHGGIDSLGVVLHGDADVQKLRDAGFTWDVHEDDLVRAGIAQRKAEAASTANAAPVPSGRTTYRNLVDYETELKKLAGENPGFVKLIEMPNKTFLGRTVLGVEITKDVNLNDGKPAFLNMGVHHAREWPSGEHAMEWAYELIKGYKAGDARATKIVEQSRNIIVPIVNPDGFNASRAAGQASGGQEGRDEAIPDTALIVAGTANGGEYRRKNCRLGDTTQANCTTSPGVAENGTDPNRNYGGLWGGPGASTQLTDPTYRGPGPFSEQETKNVQWLVSRRQVMTLISNHTTAGLVLRAPGLLSLGDPIDEDKGYKALGDAMALENGYFSQKSWELYDTTGTTEDWSYNATGGFGFTFEIYCGTPNYTSGNCDDPAFHPKFETMAKEWEGSSPQNNHVNDPGNSPAAPFGMKKGYDGKGNREAYYIAAESTLNEKRHSIIEGDAPAGAVLKLTKAFKTETYAQGDGPTAKPLAFDDKLETQLDVPASGKFRWHVNPSSRPIIEKDRGRDKKGEPSPPQTFNYAASPNGKVPCSPVLICAAGNDDRQLKIPEGPGIDNGKVKIRIEWETPTSDYDLKIFRPGAPAISQDTLASSAQRATNFEEVTIFEPKGEYLIRVANVNGVEPWSGTIKFESPDPFQKGKTEAYTLTCELNGQQLHTSQLFIARGQALRPDLGACDRRPRSAAPPTVLAPAPPGGGRSPLQGCFAGSGFRSVGVTPQGAGARFSFARRLSNPVTVSVFQQSSGKRITGEQLVARFTRKTKTFTWDGKATTKRRRVRDGYLFVRFSIATPNGPDVRRVTLRRSRGKLAKRPDFYRRATCDRLPSFKIERPVFGGRTNRPLNISFRLTDDARVKVEVLKGTDVVRSFGPTNRKARITHRLRVDPKTLKPGEYKVRITVPGAPKPLVAVLTARRL